MNHLKIEAILVALNTGGVRYLVIGGVNFMLRHVPLLTYDVDIWVEDSTANLERLAKVLNEIKAEWGRGNEPWKVVSSEPGWLRWQGVFCLTTPLGALDVFREVRGLEGQFEACYARGVDSTLATGTPYRALSDEDMLRSQLALAPHQQNAIKIDALKKAIEHGRGTKAT